MLVQGLHYHTISSVFALRPQCEFHSITTICGNALEIDCVLHTCLFASPSDVDIYAVGWVIRSVDKLRIDRHQVPRKRRALGYILQPVAVSKCVTGSRTWSIFLVQPGTSFEPNRRRNTWHCTCVPHIEAEPEEMREYGYFDSMSTDGLPQHPVVLWSETILIDIFHFGTSEKTLRTTCLRSAVYTLYPAFGYCRRHSQYDPKFMALFMVMRVIIVNQTQGYGAYYPSRMGWSSKICNWKRSVLTSCEPDVPHETFVAKRCQQ